MSYELWKYEKLFLENLFLIKKLNKLKSLKFHLFSIRFFSFFYNHGLRDNQTFIIIITKLRHHNIRSLGDFSQELRRFPSKNTIIRYFTVRCYIRIIQNFRVDSNFYSICLFFKSLKLILLLYNYFQCRHYFRCLMHK